MPDSILLLMPALPFFAALWIALGFLFGWNRGETGERETAFVAVTANTLSLLALLVTGVMFWRPWFAGAFPIPVIRIAALIHAFSAFVLILTLIVHVYAAIWVRGTMRAMTRGTVTEGWARTNHALWHEQVTQNKP